MRKTIFSIQGTSNYIENGINIPLSFDGDFGGKDFELQLFGTALNIILNKDYNFTQYLEYIEHFSEDTEISKFFNSNVNDIKSLVFPWKGNEIRFEVSLVGGRIYYSIGLNGKSYGLELEEVITG
ncbi:hypothetical protein PBI_PBS1_240 [Bacillus phage PBS1]|uniref:Uncharacterized protein n=1 Tax=Bacillus phage PBS1 TaxID=2884423 RepID=A0A223LEW7_BPPB1|nr:hypothetical protein FK780_gp207 [Bacillus phage PBS1]ASU00062.1 hypothetical protein PBI_PBS1_240 [Bacillus phage PBS1]BDE75428.1 hypothetical protein [Bacillus phage PBS1]